MWPTIRRSAKRGETSRAVLRRLAAALASGALLYAADHPVHAWPLSAIALVPWFWALASLERGHALHGALLGAALGVAYTAPIAAGLHFPLAFAALQVALLSAQWALAGALAAAALRTPGALGALGAASAIALVEWAGFSLVPIWGTAQSFARTWSAAPPVASVVAYAGVGGLVFAVAGAQALLARLVWQRERRFASGVVLCTLVIAVAVCAFDRATATGPMLRVAAAGWSEDALRARGGDDAGVRLFERIAAPLVREATSRGARVIVLPEAGFSPEDPYALLARFVPLARAGDALIVVGLFDRARRENRAAFVRATGVHPVQYRKTHLVPTLERYPPGDGTLVQVPFAGARVGALICQDDNFTDLARGHGRALANVLAVPTNDWPEVAPYHLENSLLRPIEQGYALVRAASDGTSVIADATGAVLVSSDHLREGASVLVADVALTRGGTLYARFGDWIAVPCLVLLLAALRRRRAAAP